MDMIMKKSEKLNIIALACAAVGIICTFLAKRVATLNFFGTKVKCTQRIFFGKTIGSANGEKATLDESTLKFGIVILIFLLIAGILHYLRYDMIAIVPAAVNAVFTLIKIIQVSKESGVHADFFFWLILIASIAEIAAVFVAPKLLGDK